MIKLFRYGRDLSPNLRANIALDEVIHLIEPGYGTEGLICEVYSGINQQLLRKLDDGTIRATTCLLAPPWVRSPETTWIIRSIW